MRGETEHVESDPLPEIVVLIGDSLDQVSSCEIRGPKVSVA